MIEFSFAFISRDIVSKLPTLKLSKLSLSTITTSRTISVIIPVEIVPFGSRDRKLYATSHTMKPTKPTIKALTKLLLLLSVINLSILAL